MPIYIKARPDRRRSSPLLFSIKLLSTVLLLLAVAHFIVISRMNQSSPVIDTCSSLIRNADYTTYVGLQPATQQMAAVQFVDQLVGGAPAALVSVTNSNAQSSLDVYVYGCTMQHGTPDPTLLLKRQGLIQGTVEVSDANTLVIGERDPTISQENSVLLQPLQQNIFQEYAWQHGGFVQIPFSALYPVTNRSGAATLQTEASEGQQLPWSDPLVTAEQMAHDVLHWPTTDPGDSLLDNSGNVAHVLLMHRQPELRLTVTLRRLMQQNSGGLWFVTAASTAGITLDQARWRYPLSSPIALQGTLSGSTALSTIQLLDHTYNPVPLLDNPTLSLGAQGQYSAILTFTSTYLNQQGLLLIETMPNDKGAGELLLASVVFS